MAEILLVVDEIIAFMPEGNLPVPTGREVIEPTNTAIRHAKQVGIKIIKANDSHPENSIHFDTWPPHAIAGTPDAKPPVELLHDDDMTTLLKGTGPNEHGYSAFEGRSQDGTTLDDMVGEGDTIHIAGLVTEHCIMTAALDSASRGIKTRVLSDAIRPFNEQEAAAAIRKMEDAGVVFSSVSEFIATHPIPQ